MRRERERAPKRGPRAEARCLGVDDPGERRRRRRIGYGGDGPGPVAKARCTLHLPVCIEACTRVSIPVCPHNTDPSPALAGSAAPGLPGCLSASPLSPHPSTCPHHLPGSRPDPPRSTRACSRPGRPDPPPGDPPGLGSAAQRLAGPGRGAEPLGAVRGPDPAGPRPETEATGRNRPGLPGRSQGAKSPAGRGGGACLTARGGRLPRCGPTRSPASVRSTPAPRAGCGRPLLARPIRHDTRKRAPPGPAAAPETRSREAARVRGPGPQAAARRLRGRSGKPAALPRTAIGQAERDSGSGWQVGGGGGTRRTTVTAPATATRERAAAYVFVSFL